MEKKQIEIIAKGVNPKCIGCIFLDINDSETRIHCNKKDEPITEQDITCKERKESNTVETNSKPLENEQHELFCQEYIVSFNGAEAARSAGYSEKTARVKASQLLTKVNIQERVEALVQERNERVQIKQDDIAKDLIQIKERCMQSVPVMVWNQGLQRYVEKKDEEGRTVYQFDANNAIKSLDLLGKHTGFYEKDNSQQSGNVTIIQLPDNGRT